MACLHKPASRPEIAEPEALPTLVPVPEQATGVLIRKFALKAAEAITGQVFHVYSTLTPNTNSEPWLSKYFKRAQKDRVLITRHGKPAGILVALKDEDEWFDYQLENDPKFLERVGKARKNLEEGKGVRLEGIESAAEQKQLYRRYVFCLPSLPLRSPKVPHQ